LYPKLPWLDKVSSLEIACSLNPQFVQKLLDKVTCDILISEYEELASSLQTQTIIQLMGTYYQMKYQRAELWQKLEQVLSNRYEAENKEAKKNGD